MIRITEHNRGRAKSLRVEGSLTGQTVAEFAASAETHLVEGRGGVELDLAGVVFVDRQGFELVRSLVRRGARVVSWSGLLGEMMLAEPAIDSLTGSSADATAIGAEPASIAERSAESSLIGRLRRNDDAAYEELVRANAPRMLVAARKILNVEQDAQDAVQEAFLSAFKALEGYRGSSSLSTWLHRIVVNCALMKRRSRRSRPERSIESLLPQFEAHGHWIAEPVVWETPGADMENAETRAIVRACVDDLPDGYRQVFLMREIEEMDTQVVAEMLGITPNAVKVRLHRARQALKTLLETKLGLSASRASDAKPPSARERV
jgi:RNA polymerase sigma-70 factor (ECF subfamily)